MELEERLQSDAEPNEEEDAFLKHLEKAHEVANGWPEWKRRSGLRFWPNGETEESEGENKSNGKIEPDDPE